ncbi:nucleoside recognition domain-containing protein [Phragmitibacter flavus]|uniref:nucleoside recognition domain-containing protein n=1 Tax=Phragmitibacter flavus TaxID=2576071 RepID=UPI00197FA875|nr:nucleoside recognition domain-containing protein [Phragmitibacter flavus]
MGAIFSARGAETRSVVGNLGQGVYGLPAPTMLNYVWSFLLIVGLIAGALFGRFEAMMTGMFATCKDVVMVIALPLAGMMMLWLGILRLMEKSGMMEVISRALSPVMRRLFPEVPPTHPAMGAMTMNLAANMLGLGNSATPLGLKAMVHLQELNPHKQSATNAMCMFLALNTAGFALVPMMAINYLATGGVPNPQAIIAPAFFVTFGGSLVAIAAAFWLQGRAGFRVQPDEMVEVEEGKGDGEVVEKKTIFVMSPLRKILLVVSALAFVFGAGLQLMPEMHTRVLETTGLKAVLENAESRKALAAERKAELEAAKPAAVAQQQSQEAGGWRKVLATVSLLAIPLVLLVAVLWALAKGVAVYEEMVEGAKEGFGVAVKIMPFLVVMLTALTLFRESGAMVLLEQALRPLLNLIGMPVELLPLAIMRPLSGSGSAGLLNELILQPGLGDSLKYVAAILYGSSETTFYVLAVYFGSVGIRRVRHSLAAGLIADLAGTIGAIGIGRLIFG